MTETSTEPRTHLPRPVPPAPDASGTPQAALARGRAALAARDRDTAIRWLDRAHRLAPTDAAGAFLLASALSGTDDARAAAMLTALIAAHPAFWAASIALAALLCRRDDSAGAARLLHHVLAHAAPPADAAFRNLADIVAARAGMPGWIGAGSDGHVLLRGNAILHVDNTRVRIKGKPDGDGLRRIALPAGWESAASLTGMVNGQHVLGSPLHIRAHIRAEGFAAAAPNGDITGWAWLPGDPDTAARLTVLPGMQTILADDDDYVAPDGDGVSRPRGFRIPRRMLRRGVPVHVRGPDGADLFGSPIYPAAPDRRGTSRRVPARAPVDVVIPVYRGAADFLTCLASLRRCLPAGTRMVVVEDASPDPELRAVLADTTGIILLHHPENRGFPAAANTGLRHAGAGRDVVLLNPDTLLPRHWLRHLADAAYAAPDIGSVTPMTNDGTLTSYPAAGKAGPAPDQRETDRLDRLCRASNAGHLEDLPTAVGFCMFIRHDCLADTGLFREDVFAQGYGEENDWSLRAAQRGWRHVADTASFVSHAGGRSFGGIKAALLARNLAILNRLHPGYAAGVAAFLARDPLAAARGRIDAARWRQGACAQGAVILVSHRLGGGVERHVRGRAEALRTEGLRPIILQPDGIWPPVDSAAPRHTTLSDGPDDAFPNLRFDPARDMAALVALLRDDRPRWVELHQLTGHDPAIARLGAALAIPYDVVLHDFAGICPRITLCGASGRYCGEPVDSRDCDDCVADTQDRLFDPMPVASLRARTARLAAAARMVIAPSEDAAHRLARYIRPRAMEIRGWETDLAGAPPPVRAPGRDVHVCLAGAIGEEKGYRVLLACARDAARRALALRFTLVGHSVDDSRLLDTGRVTITGAYREDEAAALVRAQQADIGLLPSVWPETWCYSLSYLLAAGLWPVAFDLGAQAERIRRTGSGSLLPLGLPAARINDFLLDIGTVTTTNRAGKP